MTAETPGSLPSLNDGEFGLFQRLIQREAGIHLADVKKPLLVSRLSRRLRELGLDSFGAYYRRVENDAEERLRMLDRVTTNKTQFFRDPTQFEFVEKIVLPEWAAAAPPRPARSRVTSSSRVRSTRLSNSCARRAGRQSGPPSRPLLPGILRAWEPLDDFLSDRRGFRDLSNMLLVHAARDQGPRSS